ncbi:MAG TPA: rhomboid family intramembrane serine protease, partial [bacterium]
GNMWFLWVFGNNVEDAMGHLKFIIFYILCGIGAAMTQTIAAPNSQIPMVGASGAISGVLGAYLFLYPRAIVLTAVPIFFFIKLLYIPAAIFITLWFIFQILSSINMNPSGGGVAWFAHIGGFISGIVFLKAFYTRRKR